MISLEDFHGKVVPDVTNIKVYKISYIYWALPMLNTQNMETWFKEVTGVFSKANGVIQIVKPSENKEETGAYNLDYWELPESYKQFNESYNTKIEDHLKYFGGEFEAHMNWYVRSLKGHTYMKFIFTPLIEVKDEEIFLFFINVSIYSNGVISIELVSGLITSGHIKEDRNNNVVFLWKNTQNQIVGSDKVGTSGKRFKGIDAGSDSRYGFSFKRGAPNNLYVFESAIDAMSYVSLNKNISGEFVSMNGLKRDTLLSNIVLFKEKYNKNPEKFMFV